MIFNKICIFYKLQNLGINYFDNFSEPIKKYNYNYNYHNNNYNYNKYNYKHCPHHHYCYHFLPYTYDYNHNYNYNYNYIYNHYPHCHHCYNFYSYNYSPRTNNYNPCNNCSCYSWRAFKNCVLIFLEICVSKFKTFYSETFVKFF